MTREQRVALALAAGAALLVALDVLACSRAWWTSPLCLPLR